MGEIMVCEACGHEQMDMGADVPCPMCGGKLVPKENETDGTKVTDAQPPEKGEGPAPDKTDGAKQPMREIVTHQCGAGMDEAIKILVMDEPGPGNDCHEYEIQVFKCEPNQKIKFQKGAVAEAGPNGISCESLLAVIIDRLEGFQTGPYLCEENRIALDHCQRAIRTLQGRTINRAARNVEGQTKT